MATQQSGTPNIFNINPNDPRLYKFLSTPATSAHFAPSKYDQGLLPGMDLEEYRSQRQSWQDKLGNGLAKFTSSAFTGALESTVGAVYGATSALVNRDASKFWDNEFGRSLDGITEGVNEMFPHYYSEAEKNATALGSMGYQNFWFDKALGSAGYTVGSLMVGLGAGKVFQLGKAARLAQLGEEAIIAEGAAAQAAGGLGRAAAKKTAWDVSKELGLGMMMAHGESSIEARQSADQTKKFYEDARNAGRGNPQLGIPPDAKYASYANLTDDKINQLATDAGNSNYLMNLAITGGTNMMLLGKFLPGKKAAIKEYNAIGQRTAKAAANEAVEGVEKVAVAGATEYFDKVASKKFGALLNPLRAFGQGFITEGGQEGLQYASNIASQEFVKNRAIDKQDWISSLMEGVGEGLSKTLTDKEGLESILLGGVTGGPFGLAGARAERLMREENTRQLVTFMNNDPNFKNANDKVAAFLSSTKQINEAEDSLKQGDHFNAKNKSDQALNTYLKSVIDNGSQDYFITRLESLKSVGDEELAKHFGKGTTAEDVDKIIDKLGTLEKLNDDLITLYGISGGTKEQQVYNGQLRDRLFFAASTIKDEEKRIADIQNELQGMGNSKIDNLLQLRQAALTIADTVESYPVDTTKTSEEQKKEQEKYLAEIKENAYIAYNKAVTKFGEENSIDGAQALTLLSDLNGLTERKANFIEYYNALNDPDKAVKLKAQEDGYLQANAELNEIDAQAKAKADALTKTNVSIATKAIKVDPNRETKITYKDVDTNIAKYDQNTLEELAQDIEEDLIDADDAEDFETRAKLVEARNKVIAELEFRKNTQAKVDTLVDKLANATPDQVDAIVKEIKDAGFDVDAEYVEKLKDSLKEAIKAQEAFENRKAEINKNFKGANQFFHSFTEKNAAQKENLREALGRPNPTKLLHFVARKEPNAGAIVPVGDNPKLKKRVPEVVLEVWSGGIDETTGEVFKDIQVGVMPWYGQYLYPDGTPIDIQNLSEKEYAELFGPDSTDPAKYSLDSFKAAQRKMQSLYTEVKGILGDKSSEKIFPGKVKSLGTFSLTGGTYNITNDDTSLNAYLQPDVVNKPYMKNGSPVILSISSYDGTTGTFPNKTVPITSSTPIAGILDGDGNNVLHNSIGENDDTLLPALNTLKQRITQPKTGEGIWNKYWMLVEDPAGTITIEGSDKNYDWRPVTPNLLQEEERTNLFTELLDLAKQAIEDKDKPLDSAQKEVNKARTIAANEGLFIALSTGTVDKQYKNAGLSFGTGPKGLFCSLDLQLNMPLNDNGVKVYEGKIYFDIPSTVTTVEEFITFFNDAIKKQQVLKYQGKIAGSRIQGQVAYSINNNIQPLTLKSFRKNFRGEGEKKGISNITSENVWDSFSTNVSVVQPRTDQKVKFVPKSEASSVVIPTPGKTVVASTTMLDTIEEINKYFNELVITKTAGADSTLKFYIKNPFILPQDVTDNKDFLEQEVNSEQEAIDIVNRFIESTKVAKSSDAKTDELTAYQNLLVAAQKTDDAIALLQTPAFESMIDADEFDAFAQQLSNDPATAQEMQAIAGLTATTEEELNKVIGQFILTRFLNKKIEELTNKLATNLSSNEALENVTPEEFEEVLRLSEFFLNNPREPGVVGDARSKFPNMFKALTDKLFSIRQLEGDLNNRIQALIDNGAPVEEARAIAQKEFTESEGGKNAAELSKHYNDLDQIGQQVGKKAAAKTTQPAPITTSTDAKANIERRRALSIKNIRSFKKVSKGKTEEIWESTGAKDGVLFKNHETEEGIKNEINAKYDAELAALNQPTATPATPSRREADNNAPSRESVKYKLQNKIAGIDNPTVGNEVVNLSEAIKIAGFKLNTPIQINEGEITHIIFDQEESMFRFTYKGQKFAAFYVANARGKVRWEVSKFNDQTGTYQAITLDELKNISEKYGSERNLLLSLGAKELVEDIENFEKVEYSKEDKASTKGIIPLENTVSAEQIRLGKKYGVSYTLEDFLREYDAALETTTPPVSKGRRRTGGKAGEANKTGFYSEEDTIKLDAAIQNLSKILPSWIKVEELQQLASSLRQGKITFGSFYKNVIKLSKYAKTGTEFHEAFHAIFRTLLTDKQQDALYAEAKDLLRQELKKQGKTYNEGFTEFKKERPDYAHLSDEILKDLYLEEWMADEFAKYTQGKSVIKAKAKATTFVGKMLEKFFDLIKRIGKLFNEKPTLQNLFADIESGKFRNDKQRIKNRFSTNPELNEEAHSAIYVGDSEDGLHKRFLNGDIRLRLENTVASNVLSNMRAGSTQDPLTIINDELAKLGQRFNLDDPMYDTLFSDVRYSAQAELIQDLDYLFNSPEDLAINSREQFIESVKTKLKEFNIKEFESSADESIDGDQNITERSFDLNNENKGGFSSLSKFLRKYIGTTVYTTSLDEFLGLPKGTVFEGQEITIAVNPKKVYDGLVKICANQANPGDVLRKMWYASKENTEGAKFLYKFFEDAGISYDETNQLDYNPDKYDLVQQVTKGFNLFSVDYIFTHVDSLNKDSKTYRANRKDMDYIQVQNWKDNFANLFKALGSEKLKDNANNIKGLQLITRNSANTYEADKIDLDKTIDDLQKSLASIGVNLSKMFLRYALLANPNRTKTAEQIDFVQQFEGQVKLNYQQIYDNLNTIRQLVSEGADPFTRQEKIGKEEDSVTKSMKIALDNAVFDENVFVTSMVNADNKNIYPYQQPNYHVQKIKELNTLDFNDPKVIEAIHSEKPNQDYLENNYLLNNPVFKYMLKNLAIERIDGIKQAELEKGEDGEKKLKRSNKDREGVTYGSMTDREVWTQMYSLFADSSTDEVIPEQKADGKVLKVSHSVRRMIFNIMEASNTADVLKMSVRTLFSNGEVNKTFIDAQVAEVERELQRIERVKKGVYTDKYNKFNAYTPQGKERGKKFWESAQLLESIPYTNAAGIQTTLKDALETGAVTLEEARPVLEKGIKSYFAAHLIEHEKELKRLGILSEKGENRLLHGKFEGGPKAEGDSMFGGSLRNNLFNAYLNMYLNNTAINQILMGDPALTLKDSTDWFKRARGNNASGPNLVSFADDNTDLRVSTFGRLTETGELDDFVNDSYVKPKERIIKIGSPEWEEFSKDLSADEKQAILDKKTQEIKVGDAQCNTTVAGFTKFMKGLGRLTARGKEIYKRIEQGGTVTEQDWKYLVDNNLMMNSLKLVYYDGTTYIKMSVVPLTKDFTTDSDGFPRPGYDFLHDMRLEMEMNNVDMMGQPSMMKKMIKNPIALSNNERLSITEENVNKLSLGYLRLQQENPSNKIHIKDPTQMLQIIAAEQNPETVVILPDGTDTTVGEILKRYDKGLVERVREQYKAAREFMFPLENGKRVINMKRATKVFRKLLEETGASQQLLDYLETDDQGNPIENLNAPSIVTAFEQHFNAYFNKVLSQKIPGYKVTLQSQFGMSPILYELATGKIITRYEYNLNPSRYRDSSKYGTRKLAFDQPRMVNGKETHRYSEVLIPYHFAEQFNLKPGDAIPEELAYMFGVRIPSQDKHSALVLKVVDVLPPYYGSNMVGPDELILLTGSDFDIDSFYIHRMDHYVREGKLVPYGNSLDSKWSQYKRWNKDNNIFLKDLMDELSEDDQVLQGTSDEVKRLRKKLSQIEAIEASVRDGDYSDMPAAQRELLADKPAIDLLRKSKEKELDAYENALLELALRELKLPYNEELFNKSGIRNIGEINNEILTAKMILHSNSSMSDINKTPATLEAIENVLGQIAKALGYAKWQDLEKSYNPNTPLGMVKAFTTNKAGQVAIGAATNNTINYSILSRFGIKARSGDDVRPIRFTFKDAQGKEVEIKIGDIITTDLTTEDGMRIMDILSTLTSSMTDNTKYGYNSKMNIDINTLSVASLLSMNKVPISKIGYMLKSEYIVKLAEESRSYAIQTESEAKYQEKADIRLMNQLIDKLKAISPGMSAEDIKKIGNSPITDADLTLAMEYSPAHVRFANMTQEEREAEMDEVTKVNYYMAQLKFVSSYSALSKHSTELIAFSQIVKLTKGISSSTKETSFKGDEDLQTYLKVLNLKLVDTPTGWKVENGDAKAEDLPLYDFTEVINNHLITLENLNVFADKNELQEGYFVSQTKFAKNIRERISKALRTRMKNKLRTKAMTSLRRNLESFLMVKAWRNSLTAEEKENLNAYLYVDAAKKAGMPTLEELKTEILAAHPELSNNMIFTQVFFRTEGNKMVVQYNTRTKGNKGFEGVLLDEMRRLQNSPAFPLVKALSRHLLAKDALQFKNNSPISLLPPATLRALYQFSEFIDAYTPDLNSLNDDRFKAVFGSTIKEVSDEFEEFFLRDIDNGTYLNWVNAKELQSKDTEKTKTPLKVNEDKSFSLDLDAGVQNIKEDTEISNEQGEVIDIIDNTNEKDVTQRKRNFAIFKSFNFIPVKKEYTKKTTDKATKLVSVETKKANVFKFPKIIKIGNTLYKIASYVPVESRYKEENRVSTIPNEDGDFIGTQVTYKPIDRFIGPYGKSLEENEEYSYEKVKAASDAAKLQSAEDEAADDAEDYPESVDTKMVTNAPDITSITTTPVATSSVSSDQLVRNPKYWKAGNKIVITVSSGRTSEYNTTIEYINTASSENYTIGYRNIKGDLEVIDNIDKDGVFEEPYDNKYGILRTINLNETKEKTYEGKVNTLAPNQVFVFGSNPEGRHGAGAAQLAKNKFGAKYGQGRGTQGQAYALVTKNLTAGFVEPSTGIKYDKEGFKSLSAEQIIENIDELYQTAMANPNKEFLVAYTTDSNLNGYTPQEMADMFSAYPIPSNVVFNKEFAALLNKKGGQGTPLTKTEQLVQKNIAMQTKTALSTDEAVTGSRTLLVAQILGMSREKMQETLLAVVNAFASKKIKNLPNIVMQISKTNVIFSATGISKDGRLIDQVVRDVVEKASDEEVLELHKTMCKI